MWPLRGTSPWFVVGGWWWSWSWSWCSVTPAGSWSSWRGLDAGDGVHADAVRAARCEFGESFARFGDVGPVGEFTGGHSAGFRGVVADEDGAPAGVWLGVVLVLGDGGGHWLASLARSARRSWWARRTCWQLCPQLRQTRQAEQHIGCDRATSRSRARAASVFIRRSSGVGWRRRSPVRRATAVLGRREQCRGIRRRGRRAPSPGRRSGGHGVAGRRAGCR